MNQSARVNFVMSAESDSRLADLVRLDVDRDWREFNGGERAWILQTFLLLRAAGVAVECARGPVPEAINITHAARLENLSPDPRLFIACVRADFRPYGLAELHVVQNQAQAAGGRRVWIPHWPQPGLVPRAAGRTGVRTVVYAGRACMMAGTPGSWERALARIGLTFRLLDETGWNDLSEADIMLAIRSFDRRPYNTKPPTKLINAWHAGVPLIAGCDSAFHQIGTPGVNYFEAASMETAVAAVRRLAEDAALYEAVRSAGAAQAAAFGRNRTVEAWTSFLGQIAVPAFEAWQRRPGRGGAAWRLRASLVSAESALRRTARRMVIAVAGRRGLNDFRMRYR